MSDLLQILAVVGNATPEQLETLSRDNSDDVAQLLSDVDVTLVDSRLHLAEQRAASLLEALAEQDFLHFTNLHVDALRTLSRLQPPDREHLTRIFTQLAERLVYQQPEQLLTIIASLTEQASQETLPVYTFYQGLALRNVGRIDAALEALNRMEQTGNLDPRLQGRMLNTRAVCYVMQNRWQAALDGFQSSLAVWRQLGDGGQEGKVHLNIGITAYELQNIAVAERSLQRAEALFLSADMPTWLAAVYHEQGLLFRDQGRWSEAAAAYARCIDRRVEEDDADRLEIAHNNLAEVYLFQGRFVEARAIFEQCLRRPTTQPYRIDTLLNASLAYQIEGALEAGLEVAEQALALSSAGARHDALPAIHYRLAELLRRSGLLQPALEHIQAAISAIEHSRSPLREEAFRVGLMGRWQQVYETAVLLHLQLHDVAAAFEVTEQARARAFLDMLEFDAPEKSPTEESPTEEARSLAEIQAALPSDAMLVAFYATGGQGTMETLLAQIPASNQAIRAHLLAPPSLQAFLVSPTTIDCVRLEADPAAIAARYFNRADGRLRGVMPLAGQRMRPLRRWEELYRQLIAPLQSRLEGAAHLIWAPFGVLHYFPLHALHAAALGEQAPTASYVPSASILRALMSTRAHVEVVAPGMSLAIGVDGDGLRHSEAEARTIARALDADLLTGSEATCAAVAAALPACELVHFSCHGHFRRRTPMDSALQLADGELSAATVLSLPRLRARLVTLSACDTGLNQLAPGDELMGLTRAFLGRGVRSLVVTLWPVHELPTRLLMERFYAAWRQNANAAVALQAAQGALRSLTVAQLGERLRSFGLAEVQVVDQIELFTTMLPGDHPFDHPYYWAGFLLVGRSQ